MPAPATSAEFLELVRKSELISAQRLDEFLARPDLSAVLAGEPKGLAQAMLNAGLLTTFHAILLLQGKWRGFTLGKYRILDRLGAGGMGIVYLAEHIALGKRVAVKVLPETLARDPWFIKHFYQEARAVAALKHPNIVRAYEVGLQGKLHCLVMEYIEGTSLQEIVDRHGPMSILRASHYVRQVAQGLAKIHATGLVHRDIKPGNLLLNRQGMVKILDLGLAHFKDKAKKASAAKGGAEAMVGTDDYLPPEQIVHSDEVDIRADIYSLGVTFYFLLTGKTPYGEIEMSYQKLLSHLARSPKSVRESRPEVPEDLAAIVLKMMAKNPWDRPQTPPAVVEALAPWTQTPIPPPPPEEMPRLNPPSADTSANHERHETNEKNTMEPRKTRNKRKNTM